MSQAEKEHVLSTIVKYSVMSTAVYALILEVPEYYSTVKEFELLAEVLS